jgi:hypothetical protein
VTLNYRVMFGPEMVVPMMDDGSHGDGAAGDGVTALPSVRQPRSDGALLHLPGRTPAAIDRVGRSSECENIASLGTVVATPR